jgi:starvation-inducible DNA-binding protein
MFGETGLRASVRTTSIVVPTARKSIMASKSATTTPSKSSSKRALGAVSSTRNASFTAPGMSTKDGAAVIDILQARLSTLVELSLTLKHIHWNVVGPSFIGVHLMLDPQYAGVQVMIDTTAERIATLGGVPNGLAGHIVANRNWDDYDLGRANSQAHLAALDLVYRGVIESHRDAIEATDKPDPVTQDMLIGQTAELEQYHWFVRSHLEDYAGGLSNAGTTTELGAAKSTMLKDSAGRNGTGRGVSRTTASRTTPRRSAR